MSAKSFRRLRSYALKLAIYLSVAFITLPSWGRDAGAIKDSGRDVTAGSRKAGRGQPEIVVRLIPFELTRYDSWQLQNHNGTDVLEMIKKLKPTQLNRFFTPRPGWTAMVPMGPGSPSMPMAQYLTQVMNVCGKRCTTKPNLSVM